MHMTGVFLFLLLRWTWRKKRKQALNHDMKKAASFDEGSREVETDDV